MFKKMMTVVVAAFMFSTAAVGVAAADGHDKNPAVACQQAGMDVLRDLGALSAAARGEVDYSAFASAEEGPIFLDLDEGSFIPLKDVLALHRSNPELFAWC